MAVRPHAESKTPLHNFISPLLIILCLYVLTDVIKFIPNASLAAIVIVNLFSLFAQFRELGPLSRTSWADFGAFVVCCVFTVTMGTEAGLISGVVSSLLFLLIAVLAAKKPTDEKLEPISLASSRLAPRRPAVEFTVVTMPKSLHFLNRDTYRGRVEKVLAASSTSRVLLDLRLLAYIDVSAIMTLQVASAMADAL